MVACQAGEAGTRDGPRGSDGGVKRESFQDGGAELPVGWKTIEAASLPYRVAPFPLRSRPSLDPFTISAAATHASVTRGVDYLA